MGKYKRYYYPPDAEVGISLLDDIIMVKELASNKVKYGIYTMALNTRHALNNIKAKIAVAEGFPYSDVVVFPQYLQLIER